MLTDLEKKSIFRDVFNLHTYGMKVVSQEHISAEEFSELARVVSRLHRIHKDPFCSDMIIAVVNELERVRKEMQQ